MNCDDSRNALDKAGSVLFIAGDREYPPPVTMEQMDQLFCLRHLHAIDIVTNVTRSCLKPFPKQVIGFMTRGSRREVAAICKNSKSKAKLLDAFKCFAESDNWSLLHDSFDGLLLRFEAAHRDIPDPSLQIAHGCCDYHQYLRDVSVMYRGRCPSDLINYVTNFIKRKLKDAVDLVCSVYSDQDAGKCKTLKREHPYPNIIDGTKPQAKSAIVPLADIFTAAGEEKQ